MDIVIIIATRLAATEALATPATAAGADGLATVTTVLDGIAINVTAALATATTVINATALNAVTAVSVVTTTGFD